ncbi:META domain-containing protein [Flavobacterium sp. H4147]|uniref:META domain-containing protein n=1 Tax=unclassified Flavobacterium TaxID=196869 RepID=UPI0023ED9C1B|nr:META domain-containing protein [Flavobacterium sp. H4147]
MMKKIFSFIFISVIAISCNCTKNKKSNISQLEGSWELNYITGPKIAFDGLYPNKKPSINFDLKENRVSGNNSCNTYSGKFLLDGNKIDFTQPMMSTKMMCLDGQGENIYMNTLQKVTSYDITDDGKTLNFISGDIAVMRFTRK